MNRRRRVGLTTWIIAALAVAACSPEGQAPPPPPAPSVLRPHTPPPGADDFAHGTFATPLSIQDAETILRRTTIFEFGAGARRQVQAFNVVFERPDAVARFRVIGASAEGAGRLYALAALLLLDPAAARPLRDSLGARPESIRVFESDMRYTRPVRDLAQIIEQRHLGESFRAVRDDTDAAFEAPAFSAARERHNGQLQAYVERFSGSAPRDCGLYRLNPSGDAARAATVPMLQRSVECATLAARQHQPFWTFEQKRGIESWLAEGLLGTSDGLIYRFWYDSAPCGNPGCPGTFTIQRCNAPNLQRGGFACGL